ncbi:AAA family ATPase [Mycobacterium sp. TNTM28]|uniref:AAA family ATPase n=1 Tax=[Mycobacterium] fortunisiensis TaxID=2600579 RepID=A0ABS6KMB8_9MYCO|nr:AAA family ATPase [[Mycobacterium] fortunisiensis]MBU9764744.1 AAA family ATPase [[Mycobacterium] fortunisiensis]
MTALVDPYADVPPPGHGEEVQTLLSGLLNAADLDQMTFPELTEHVPGLIVEGFTLLVGPPKVGKSWLVGDIACGAASGGRVLAGISVKARHVLLLSLEDSPRRLQSRLRKIMRGQPLPARLDVLTDVNPLVLLATIAEWLQRHDDSAPMVILDTLGKARRQTASNANQYQEDYGFAGTIKTLIDAVPGAALVAVHHTRKQGADDFLDTVSGTQGIAGAADSVIVLSRKRKSDEGILSVTGRDIEENEYGVRTEGGLWSLDGMDILDAAATVNSRREQAGKARLGDRSADALAFVNGRSQTTPSDLAEHLDITGKAAGDLLRELFDRDYIAKRVRGTYEPKTPEIAESPETTGQPDDRPPANSGNSGVSVPGGITDRTTGMTDRVKAILNSKGQPS